jgi:hypothetical protein
MRTLVVPGLAALVAAFGLVAAMPAAARGDDDIIRRGIGSRPAR